MFYITGDAHRDFRRTAAFCKKVNSAKDDVLIILGDAGINFFGEQKDAILKQQLSELPITLFCIHGNHEKRPESMSSYTETIWHSGIAYIEPNFPSLIFAKDGEIYDFNGHHCIAIGGAYSVDKPYRLARNLEGFADEQPSDKIKQYVEYQLAKENWQIDVVLSHTCPFKYIPTEMFISGIDQSTVDNSTEEWLDEIENRLTYNRWYCGHYHTDKWADKLRFMFNDFRKF